MTNCPFHGKLLIKRNRYSLGRELGSFVCSFFFYRCDMSNGHQRFCDFSAPHAELSIGRGGKRGKRKLNHALTNVHTLARVKL